MTIRNNLYLDRDVTAALDAMARGSRGYKSRIANDLLKEVIAQRGTRAFDAKIQDRLDRMSKDIRTAGRGVTILLEAQMLLIRDLLRAIPPVSDSDSAAKKVGAQRFERFVQELSVELAKSGIEL